MTGQEAVNVAQAFDERIAFDGVILTKLDGDARGGAALCVKAITGKPIKFASTGEKVDALEVFHPDRMASRILGMGDVLTLIERAEAGGRGGRAGRDGEAHARRPVHVRRLPARVQDAAPHGAAAGRAQDDPRAWASSSATSTSTTSQLGRVEAIVLSMTPQRALDRPIVIDGKRRQRIARGSGATVEQVNQLLEARKQMEKMMKQIGRGKMPALPPDQALSGSARPAMSRRLRQTQEALEAISASDEKSEGAGRRRRSDRRQMAVKLRLTRVGSKKNPIYRVVAADSRSPRDGKFLEIVGRYNPQTDPSTIELDETKVKDWLGKGAQPTEAVAKLIKIAGISK